MLICNIFFYKWKPNRCTICRKQNINSHLMTIYLYTYPWWDAVLIFFNYFWNYLTLCIINCITSLNDYKIKAEIETKHCIVNNKMNGIIFLSIFFSVLTLNNADIQRTTVIQTNSGPVQGATLTTVWNDIEYSSFKGIPYAAPPIGNRRFRVKIVLLYNIVCIITYWLINTFHLVFTFLF